jgi:hypothetical protein
MLMDGIYVPLTAPFYRDGASYWKKLEHNVGRYSLTPAAGLVALTGEREALSEAEMRETLECDERICRAGEGAGGERLRRRVCAARCGWLRRQNARGSMR